MSWVALMCRSGKRVWGGVCVHLTTMCWNNCCSNGPVSVCSFSFLVSVLLALYSRLPVSTTIGRKCRPGGQSQVHPSNRRSRFFVSRSVCTSDAVREAVEKAFAEEIGKLVEGINDRIAEIWSGSAPVSKVLTTDICCIPRGPRCWNY